MGEMSQGRVSGGSDTPTTGSEQSTLQTPTTNLSERDVHADLSSIQRDTMRVVLDLETEHSEPPVGTMIIERLEDDYGCTLDESIIYDRLNDLADKGLLNKKLATDDRRKKGYYTTAIGKGVLKLLHDKWSNPVFESD